MPEDKVKAAERTAFAEKCKRGWNTGATSGIPQGPDVGNPELSETAPQWNVPVNSHTRGIKRQGAR